jgi:pyrrolidone-carboxylate peptidase
MTAFSAQKATTSYSHIPATISYMAAKGKIPSMPKKTITSSTADSETTIYIVVPVKTPSCLALGLE